MGPNDPDLGDSTGRGDALPGSVISIQVRGTALGHCGGVVTLFGFYTEARRTYRSFIKGLLTALCEMG